MRLLPPPGRLHTCVFLAHHTPPCNLALVSFGHHHLVINMSPLQDATLKSKVPILLLKTKSSPGDSYEDIFSQPHDRLLFEPCFVPVLEHRFEPDGVRQVESILRSKEIGSHPGSAIGGLIFTSQRAVEAFTKIVQDGQSR